MAETKKKTAKKVKKETKEVETICRDKFCPIHGTNKLKARGRTFEGVVIKKFPKKITIQFERMLKVSKYERYEKRRTKVHARLPDCMAKEIVVGDLVEVQKQGQFQRQFTL